MFSSLWERVAHPQRFFRISLLISGIWLLFVYPALNWLRPDLLLRHMSAKGSDFGQYYSGALVARHGLWQHLYPSPKAGFYTSPPNFRPKIASPFFDSANPAALQGKWGYYPQIASPSGSTVAPEILKYAPGLQFEWHYILPPPVAFILAPLGYLDYQTAYKVWFWLTTASFMSMGYLSAQIYRVLNPKPSCVEGWILLLPLLPTCLGSNMATSLETGNISPILGFLISLVVYCWLRNRQVLVASGILFLLIFKGIGIIWCFWTLFKPRKIKTLTALSILTLVINGITVWLGGAGLYEIFFRDILPKARVAIGFGIQGQLLYFLGISARGYFAIITGMLLVGITWRYWRISQRDSGVISPSVVVAAFAASLAVFYLFNPVTWTHYYSNYLLIPFSGWLIWEAQQCAGKVKTWITAILVANLLFFADSLFLLRDSMLVEWLEKSNHYPPPIATLRSGFNFIAVNVAPLIQSAVILLLAGKRLCSKPAGR